MEATLINIDGHEFEGVPWQGVKCSVYDGRYLWNISNSLLPDVPSPERYGIDQDFPNAIDAETRPRKETRDVAIDYVTVLVSQEFHEAIEHTQVEGKPLANPHPVIEDWEWLQDRLRDVVEEYIDRFPWTSED